MAANAIEAEHMARVAATTGRVLVEAFHYRYHPLAARLRAILDGGELGDVRHIATEFSVPMLLPSKVQFSYPLAGGATMDVGCYAINLLRFLAGAEPDVLGASARLIRPQVDRLMRADLRFADGCSAQMTCALLSARLLRTTAHIYGTAGELHVSMPYLPHYYHRITVRTPQATRHEHLDGDTTYTYQLRAFAQAIGGAPVLTNASDAIANMRVVDAIYTAAGLRPRG
jgi:predicted dehydrogenase